MKPRVLGVALAAILFAGFVALGVHILYKNARAETAFNVVCYDLQWNLVNGLELRITVFEGEKAILQDEPMTNLGGGNYVATCFTDLGENAKWRVKLVKGAEPVFPNRNPVEHRVAEAASFDWQVNPD